MEVVYGISYWKQFKVLISGKWFKVLISGVILGITKWKYFIVTADIIYKIGEIIMKNGVRQGAVLSALY